jgi:hypothetical protein
MARYYDKVGYGIQQEVRKSVWQDVIVEQPYFGETLDLGYKYQSETDHANDNLNLDTEFEVIADAFMLEHFSQIRYICYGGARWKVTGLKYDPPRVHIRVGGVYNGPTPNTSGQS